MRPGLLSKNKIIWIGLGLFSLLLKLLSSQFPAVVEQVYSRGLFLGIRWSIDYLLAWFPIPLIYLFVLVVLFLIGRKAKQLWQAKLSWQHKLIRFFTGLLAGLGAALFFFLFLWGFNYDRLSIEEQLGIDPQPLNVEELKTELELETVELIRLRSSIAGITDSAIDAALLPEQLELKLRTGLEQWLAENNFPTVGRVRGRMVLPKGIFLRFSSSGLYFPFTGEGHIDSGLNALQKVFVMAHEMSHGYGFGDEGTCNFLAYVSCAASDDPIIAYLGHLAYWRTVAVNYLRYKREEYQAFRETLPVGIISDLNAINKNLEEYPDIMPKFRYYAYDSYLKAQGISEGMANYSRVIMLVKAYRPINK